MTGDLPRAEYLPAVTGKYAEMIRCALCADAPCSAVCEKLEIARDLCDQTGLGCTADEYEQADEEQQDMPIHPSGCPDEILRR